MSGLKPGTQVIAIAGLLGISAAAHACVTPRPTPPPRIWVVNHGFNAGGKLETWIGIEVGNPFVPTAPTNCQCGLALGSTANPVPPGTNVLGAQLAVTNTVTGDITPITDFDFTPNGNATATFAGGVPTAPGYQSAPTGAAWAGFQTSLIDPNFVPPTLGPHEVFKLWYRVEWDLPSFAALTATNLPVAFGVGSTDPAHGPVQFGVYAIPAPKGVSLAAAGLGLICAARRRVL